MYVNLATNAKNERISFSLVIITSYVTNKYLRVPDRVWGVKKPEKTLLYRERPPIPLFFSLCPRWKINGFYVSQYLSMLRNINTRHKLFSREIQPYGNAILENVWILLTVNVPELP